MVGWLRGAEMTPRQHAAEIMKLRAREERRARLLDCPEWMRGIVQKHVENAAALRKARVGNG